LTEVRESAFEEKQKQNEENKTGPDYNGLQLSPKLQRAIVTRPR